MQLDVLSQLRSESVWGLCQQQGLTLTGTTFLGAFTRRYNGSVQALLQDGKDWSLHLNEASIYDLLPEGLFHQPQIGKANDTKFYIDEITRYKIEAKSARHFFAPFDEFFLKVKAEILCWSDAHLSSLDNYDTFFLIAKQQLHLYQSNPYLHYYLQALEENSPEEDELVVKSFLSAFFCEGVTVDVVFMPHSVVVLPRLADAVLGWDSLLDVPESCMVAEWNIVVATSRNEDVITYYEDVHFHQLWEVVQERHIPLDSVCKVTWDFSPDLVNVEEAYLGVCKL